ncbi:RNA helicase [Agrocybe pediades]|nr:RNA helicase [Agrocybe pediades]
MPLSVKKAHTRGKQHREAIAALRGESQNQGRSNRGTNAPLEQEQIPCVHCRKPIDSTEYDAHVAEHIRQQHFEQVRASLEEAKDDKEGVTVTGRNGIDFGILDTDKAVECMIDVSSTLSRVAIRKCRIAPATRDATQDSEGPKFTAHVRGKGRVIQKGATRKISLIFQPSYAGHFEATLELVFYDIDQSRTFVIIRTVEATVGSKEDHEELKPKAPYIRRKNVVKFKFTAPVVPSNRPPAWTKTVWVDRLLGYDPPARLIDVAYGPRSLGSGNQVLANVKRFMPATFNEKTYGQWFQVLLHLEEQQIKLDLDAYSLFDVELQADYPRYKLLVEGLAENRPSVLVGDFILVSRAEGPETLNTRTWYEGRVHQVHQNHVSLRFGGEFSTYRGTKFDVRFVLNRLPFRRMHQSITNKFNPVRLLFPGAAHIQGVKRIPPSKIDEIVPYYRPIGEDEEQMETVAAILNQKPGSVPFVVFGPPGTGKTITIVEAMKQILERDPDARILACSPNNSAADQIAIKLMELGKTQVFRLNSLSRRVDEMPKVLREFSCINDNHIFFIPDKEKLQKFRVVVSTCLSGGVPAALGVPRGHYSHIFIDEAGQGKEPELMVPIKSIADTKTNVILAGDNQQLGPVVNSSLARTLGLKTSYLARLMDRDIYDLDKFRGITIVKLVKNFRSHPDILKFSNDEFYKSELRTCGNKAIISSMENYEQLPKKKFPLIFHAIIGKDMRESSSPSFFNIDEATQVKQYCISLLSNRKNGLKAEHIGVITPYHAQRHKILSILQKDPKMQDIKVGSVEEFQGQERRVIIISTVRSNTDFVTSDIRRSLGFVANKNRMNVALTRAQALLIVIGNPIVLSLDPLWRAFLSYVNVKGGWRGKKIDWDPTEPVRPDGDYDAQRKTQAQANAEDAMARLRAMIQEAHMEDGLEIDDEDVEAAAYERPILREAE